MADIVDIEADNERTVTRHRMSSSGFIGVMDKSYVVELD